MAGAHLQNAQMESCQCSIPWESGWTERARKTKKTLDWRGEPELWKQWSAQNRSAIDDDDDQCHTVEFVSWDSLLNA